MFGQIPSTVEQNGRKFRCNQRGILGAVCALVIGVYAFIAHEGAVGQTSSDAADNYYNLLVRGFCAGQLNLQKEVPPGLMQLSDPYDPSTHDSYPEVWDMSYYKGKLYLYFGVTPALVLFWPYWALTGHYLPQSEAGATFCLVGFLVSVGLLHALWRRFFAEVSVLAVAAGALALGLVTLVPVVLLTRCAVWEVPISCGYALTMLSLAAIWHALNRSSRRAWWLAGASLAYGLALGARPSLLFGAAILLVPVGQTWRERRTVWPDLLAAAVPVTLIGVGLMLYNYLRFGSPFEFGLGYQLAGDRQLNPQVLSARSLWFNFRIYFLEPARWGGRFPFLDETRVPPLPSGYHRVETMFGGVLPNIPLVWLAIAVPLAWRGQSVKAQSTMRAFLASVAILFGAVALTVCLLVSGMGRYEADFLPELVLLAAVGVLSVERALSGRPLWRSALRWGWSLLLLASVAFNLSQGVVRCAKAHSDSGIGFQQSGHIPQAITQYEQALRINPNCAEAHNNLGAVLLGQGKFQEATGHFEQALRAKPDFAEAHNNLGMILAGQDKLQDAMGHFEQALQTRPDLAQAHYNLGLALETLGRTPEAIQHYQQALSLKPDFVPAQHALARATAGQ
ncbi:MAG TPA: tetratricopeptide repeat protein [Verrucomicrobiae bacterium]|nr:tetratricopeptide repeat protein [Verrucomicrobiae bacterium]